jgi:hypothetical protein
MAGLLQKILAQLPKPDTAAAAAEGAPVIATAAPDLPAAPHSTGGGGGGDAFWDRTVHVTEETLPSGQQFVPNSSLLQVRSVQCGRLTPWLVQSRLMFMYLAPCCVLSK